jgi:hypothetical protein
MIVNQAKIIDRETYDHALLFAEVARAFEQKQAHLNKKLCLRAVSALKSRGALFDFKKFKRLAHDVKQNVRHCVERAFRKTFEKLHDVFDYFTRLVSWLEHPCNIDRVKRDAVGGFLRALSKNLKADSTVAV